MSQIFCVQLCAVLTVWHLQYYQPMVITSLAVSFMIPALLFLHNQRPDSSNGSKRQKSVWSNCLALITRTFLALVATLVLNLLLKFLFGQTDDNHIFQFVASWIGYQDDTDFDTRLYRCLAVFRPLGTDMYHNLMANAALPLYIIYMGIQLIGLLLTLLRKWYVKDKEEDGMKTDKKVAFLHALNERKDLQFLSKMDEYPSKVYHIGN